MNVNKMMLVSVLVLLLSSSMAMAYTSGAPVGLTGAPSEATCADCHDNLNTGSGWVNINGPSDYSAGETIELTVQVGHNGQKKWGFQITALDASNQPIGELAVFDAARTQFDTDGGNGREYVFHTEVGSDEDVLDMSPGWTVEWTAPATRADVTFYACGVAANNGQGTNGDFCYTDALSLSETAISDQITWGRIKGLFR